jgi:hypothetical protein
MLLSILGKQFTQSINKFYFFCILAYNISILYISLIIDILPIFFDNLKGDPYESKRWQCRQNN